MESINIIKAKDFTSLNRVPHPIPYQGSKRVLSPAINQFIKGKVKTLYEPFAGSAAFSLYAAAHNIAQYFVIGDRLEPLIELWKLIVEKPDIASSQYKKVWQGQREGDSTYFNKVREDFNSNRDPILLLYLVARCVKNAVRFNKDGRFTQSVDKRRLGMNPDKMFENMMGASYLLKGKTEFFCGDFIDCISPADEFDLIYMDPPYQGTTYGRDKRYFAQLETDDLCESLRSLQSKEISFILSYDGMTGDKQYGSLLPADLNLSQFLLNAGRSSQATLNGDDAVTLESLYLWGERIKTPCVQKEVDKEIMSLSL